MSELPNYLLTILDEIAKKEGFFNYTTVTRPGSNAGDNFLGELISVALKGKRWDNNKSQTDDTLNLLCKLAPSNPKRRIEFLSSLFFGRETSFYNDVCSKFVNFQNEKGLSKEDQFLSFPKCYAAMADDAKEQYAIVMQDLRFAGYEMWPKNKPVPVENIRLVMKELAKFHAISFVMKDQRPEEFANYTKLDDISKYFFARENMKNMFGTCFDRAIKALRNPEHQKIYLDLKGNTFKYFDSCLNEKVSEKFGVITHGDCWNNNILYRFDKNGNTVKDIILVDWQIIRYISPAADLLYVIFTSTDKQLRKTEYTNLLSLYYDTLCSNIKKMGSNPQELFTYQDFQSELKRCGNLALLTSPMLIQISFVDSKDVSNLDEMCENISKDQDLIQGLSENAQLEYDTRLNDVVTDLINLGYHTKLSDI